MSPFPGKSPDEPAEAPSTPDQTDDLPDPLTMALLNVDDGNFDMALAHFSDALDQAADDKQRIKALRKFGSAIANTQANSQLGKTYLETALDLASEAGDEEQTAAIKQDLSLFS